VLPRNLSQANVKRNDKKLCCDNQENTSADDTEFPDSYRTLLRNMINFSAEFIPSTLSGGHLQPAGRKPPTYDCQSYWRTGMCRHGSCKQ
jgi:hypothetical protein